MDDGCGVTDCRTAGRPGSRGTPSAARQGHQPYERRRTLTPGRGRRMTSLSRIRDSRGGANFFMINPTAASRGPTKHELIPNPQQVSCPVVGVVNGSVSCYRVESGRIFTAQLTPICGPCRACPVGGTRCVLAEACRTVGLGALPGRILGLGAAGRAGR